MKALFFITLFIICITSGLLGLHIGLNWKHGIKCSDEYWRQIGEQELNNFSQLLREQNISPENIEQYFLCRDLSGNIYIRK